MKVVVFFFCFLFFCYNSANSKTYDVITSNNVYYRNYSFNENVVDWKLLKADNYVMLGASVTVLGILYLLPESFTNWDKDDAKIDRLASKWWKNVKEGPVVDEDDFFLNYVAHPYCGAV